MIFPFSIWECWWLAPLTFMLDLWLGDPGLPWPHPVCMVGKIMDLYERNVRLLLPKAPVMENISGMFGVLLGSMGSFVGIWLLLNIPYLNVVFAIYFSWAGLAMGCLLSTGKKVQSMVEMEEVKRGREGVSWLVSRDVSQLDRPMLRKTLADTLSENFTDAFLAPFFWLLLTGPAGLWAYKAVSTLDSQWGYLTPRWREFGYGAAKADDLLAWIPARLAAMCLRATDLVVPHKRWNGAWPGFRRIRKDAMAMPSPNSGWSMASCAWLCNGRMAGPSTYFGALVHKPWLGPADGHMWDKGQLDVLHALLLEGSICGALLLWLFGMFLRFLI